MAKEMRPRYRAKGHEERYCMETLLLADQAIRTVPIPHQNQNGSPQLGEK